MTEIEQLAEAVAEHVKETILAYGEYTLENNLPKREDAHWEELSDELQGQVNNRLVEEWDKIKK